MSKKNGTGNELRVKAGRIVCPECPRDHGGQMKIKDAALRSRKFASHGFAGEINSRLDDKLVTLTLECGDGHRQIVVFEELFDELIDVVDGVYVGLDVQSFGG